MKIKIENYEIKSINVDGEEISNIKQLLGSAYWDIVNNIIYWLSHKIETTNKKTSRRIVLYPHRKIQSSGIIDMAVYCMWKDCLRVIK